MASVELMGVPDKSDQDQKAYRIIKLSNGLKALLISLSGQKHRTTITTYGRKPDTTAVSNKFKLYPTNSKLAACSLCIDVGAFSDPPNIQGLAHFLEHMLFMGSKKYPDEDAFDQFMQKSGGSIDALTSYDYTNFYFVTREEFLNEALDRFSQLFIAPLLLKEAMTREREAVDSEFIGSKNDDYYRRAQLLFSTGQPGHPIRTNTFLFGNLKTLKDNIDDDVLYHKLCEFRSKHYSAHRMDICLRSKLSLDELQEMVTRHFSTVPTNDLPADDFSAFTHQNAFQAKFHEKVYFVKPNSNTYRVDMTWCLEPMTQKFKTKPDYYVGQILGDEGHGSLLSYLRKQLWANELEAGTDFDTSTRLCTLFTLNVILTELGFDHLDDVLEAIFSYLKLMQLSGPKESIFRDMQTIRSNAFRFTNITYVSNLAVRLKKYPPKYILTGENLLFEYDPNEIQKVIDELNSRQFNIMITSARRYNKQVTFEMIEPWYGTQYTEMDMPTKWISSWENAKPFPEFSLLEPNPFIANDFTILYKYETLLPKYPTKIFENDLCELWFRQDNNFWLPTACYYFYFMTPVAIASIDNTVLLAIMKEMLVYQFVEKLYPASEAGLKYECLLSDVGLVFKAEGFNQKLHLVVEEFCRCLKSLADDSTEEQFKVFVQQQYKTYENTFLNPRDLSNELRLTVTESHHQPLNDKYRRLKSITFDDFQIFCRDFCRQMRIKALIQGNITEKQAQNIAENVLKELNCRKIKNLPSIELRTTKLPIGAYYLRCKVFNPKDANSIIANYYQIGPTTHHTQALVKLLQAVSRAPLFDTLRTNEQLAYDVQFLVYDHFGILGYSIFVNSQETKFSAEHVDDRIEHFRRNLRTIIRMMSTDDFDTIKSSLAKNKFNKDITLSDEVQRNWDEITSGEYVFDRHHTEAEELSNITKDELLEFYTEHYCESERKLSIQVIGNELADDVPEGTETEEGNYEDLENWRRRFESISFLNFMNDPQGFLIIDLAEFKDSLEVYPITKVN